MGVQSSGVGVNGLGIGIGGLVVGVEGGGPRVGVWEQWGVGEYGGGSLGLGSRGIYKFLIIFT